MPEGHEPGVAAGADPDQNRSIGLLPLLMLLALLSGVHQFHRFSLAALSDPVMKAFGKTDVELGGLMSAFFFAYTLAMAAGGWLADRIGTHRTLLLVAAGSALSGLGMGAVGWAFAGAGAGWISLFLVRGVMGIACAPLYPSTSRTVERWFPRRLQAFANAVVTAAAPLGIALAFPVMGSLERAFGWPAAFAIAGGVTLPVVLAWVILGRRGTAGGTGLSSDGVARALFRHRGMLGLAVSYLCVGYYEYVLMMWLNHYLKNVRHVPAENSEWYTAIPNYAMMVCAPLGGVAVSLLARRVDLRIALRIVPMVSMTLAAVFLALGAYSTEVSSVVACVALGMGFIGAAEGPFWTAAVRIGRSHGATAAGIMNTAGNIPGIVAPMATPYIARLAGGGVGEASGSIHGWTVALIVTSLICLSGVSFWLWVDVDKPCE